MKLVTILALVSAFYPALAWADAARVLPDKAHVYVEGSAEFEVAADTLTIATSIESVDTEVEVAKSDVDERSRTLIAVCEAIGIATKNISSTALSVAPSYEYVDGHSQFEGTRVARHIEIVLEDLSRYSELMQGIVGAKVAEITSTRLEATESAAFEDRALQTALADATVRARGLAEAAGRELGPVYSISEFQLRRDVWQLRSSRMTVSSATGESDYMERGRSRPQQEPFTPGVLNARAEVYVVFELKK